MLTNLKLWLSNLYNLKKKYVNSYYMTKFDNHLTTYFIVEYKERHYLLYFLLQV